MEFFQDPLITSFADTQESVSYSVQNMYDISATIDAEGIKSSKFPKQYFEFDVIKQNEQIAETQFKFERGLG